MPNTRENTTREMTFEEEAKFYEKEARAEFAKETGGGDCSVVNSILRRGMRIISKARQEIANGVTVQEWISVKDRLPDNKEHDWVLAQVVEDNGFMHIPKVMEYRKQRNDWYEETYGWLSEHNGAFTVTHWMPLPQPPKGE